MIVALLLGGIGITPAERDAMAWPVYLDDARLRAMIDDQVATWAPCGSTGAASGLSVGLRLGKEGSVLALESDSVELPYWQDLVQWNGPFYRDGYLEVPNKPGLGVELNEAVCRKHLAGGSGFFD